MANWLFKTEPNEFSISDLERSPKQSTRWDGIRNYQARNFIRDNIKLGDTVWMYHSQVKPVGLVGLAEVITEPYPDPAQFDSDNKYFDAKSSREQPRWYCVDIRHIKTFAHTLAAAHLKTIEELQDMTLFKQGRLSIQPISDSHAAILMRQIEE